ncbi:hypothetical protein FDUTEX481_06883 [Tolypothrix sp. PCC 7601]|nr:hypothetical protein FDUTEX481_06883 [Tolypothrix sp. PCC 7601]
MNKYQYIGKNLRVIAIYVVENNITTKSKMSIIDPKNSKNRANR